MSTPRYRLIVYELRDGKTTQKIDVYGSGFITAVATLDDDLREFHFGSGGPRALQHDIAAAIADEHATRPPRQLITARAGIAASSHPQSGSRSCHGEGHLC